MTRSIRWMFAAAVACLLTTSICWSQDQLLDELYGRGVHNYFARNYATAHQHLTDAINSGSMDPRVYYFRALAYSRLGRPDEARADFTKGAELEVAAGDIYPIGRSLERVQGNDRVALESYRRNARLLARTNSNSQAAARMEATRRSDVEVLRNPGAAKPPGAAAAGGAAAPSEPFGAAEPDPFGGAAGGNPLPPPPTPAPAPAPMPAPADDPFGGAAPMPAPAPAPVPPPADDPFGGPAPAPAPMPAPAPVPPPADDPFGGAAPAPAPMPAPAPVPPPADDPFGGAAPAPAPMPAPAPAADPFGGAAAVPADPFGAGAAPAVPAPAPGGGGSVLGSKTVANLVRTIAKALPGGSTAVGAGENPAPIVDPAVRPADAQVDPFKDDVPMAPPGPMPMPANDPFGAPAPAAPAPAAPAADDPFGVPAAPAPMPAPAPAPVPAPAADDPFGPAPAPTAPAPAPAPPPAADPFG